MKQGLDLSSLRIAMNGGEPVSPETLELFYQTFSSCGFKREAWCPSYGKKQDKFVFISVNEQILKLSVFPKRLWNVYCYFSSRTQVIKDEFCKKVVGNFNAFAALCRNCTRYARK